MKKGIKRTTLELPDLVANKLEILSIKAGVCKTTVLIQLINKEYSEKLDDISEFLKSIQNPTE